MPQLDRLLKKMEIHLGASVKLVDLTSDQSRCQRNFTSRWCSSRKTERWRAQELVKGCSLEDHSADSGNRKPKPSSLACSSTVLTAAAPFRFTSVYESISGILAMQQRRCVSPEFCCATRDMSLRVSLAHTFTVNEPPKRWSDHPYGTFQGGSETEIVIVR